MIPLLLALLSFTSQFAQSAPSEFQSRNGFTWFYSSRDGIRYSAITARLDELKRNGIRIVGIYSPYKGNPDKWHGCAPLDFYDVPATAGRLEDFRNLVRAAHERDIKVVAYFTNIFVDRDSEFFRSAERQYAAGDTRSREVSSVHWSRTGKDSLPFFQGFRPHADLDLPEAESPRWLYSSVAKAWYWSLWGEVGFDFHQNGARAEVERVMRFWLVTGLDGFMFDAGVIDAKYKHHMVDLVQQAGSGDKWITFESTEGEAAARQHAFGLTSWFNFEDNDHVNDYGRVVKGMATLNQLESAFKFADEARRLGKTTHAWAKAPLEDESDDEEEAKEQLPYENEDLMYPQEAALLAGAGILYGAADQAHVDAWPSPRREAWSRVLRVVNAHPALLPVALRARVPASGGNGAFALLRNGGSRRVLLAFNLSGRPATVALSLRGLGIAPQVPADVLENTAAPEIKGETYSLALPAWGYRFLEVK